MISFVTLLIYACLQPVYGFVSDKVGRRPILMMFGILGTLCTVPILTGLQNSHTAMGAFLWIMALPYAVTVSIFGGTAEYVALLFKSGGHESYFYWYVTACIFGSLLVYGLMRDTRDRSAIVD